MKYWTLAFLVLLLAGCGGTKDLTCDDVRAYQRASEGKRIETPEDLDGLQDIKEMPMPRANPAPPRTEGSPCLDLPPDILGTEG